MVKLSQTGKRGKKVISRREFIKSVMAVGGVAAAGSVGFPNILRGAVPPEIKIGDILPVSGFLAFDGQIARRGHLLGVKEINDAGGIKSLGGAKLALLGGDSEGKPDRAIPEVERLYRAGAVAITGAYQSSVSLVATQIAEKLRVPFLVDLAVDDKITGREFKYTFHLQPNSTQMGSKTLRYLSEIAATTGEKIGTIAYLHDNTSFGTSLSEVAVKYAPQYGMQLITLVPYSPQAADVTTEVAKIKSAGADIILFTGYIDDGIRVLQTMRNLRVKAKAIVGVGSGYSKPSFIDQLGKITEYVMDGNLQPNPLSPLTKRINSEYEAAYGEKSSNTVPWACWAIHIIADAIERAKSADREAIREALIKTNMTQHPLPQGPIIFLPDGRNKDAGVGLTQVLNSKIQMVWPKEFAESKPVFPVPN